MPEKAIAWMRGLFAPTPQAAAPRDLTDTEALIALMVRAARASDDYDPRQIAEIDVIIARRFGLGPFETAALRGRAEAAEARIGDSVHLTRRIKDLIALEDRPAMLHDLWSVILADGQRHEAEDGMMRLVSNLLGLTDRDSALARQAVLRMAQPQTD